MGTSEDRSWRTLVARTSSSWSSSRGALIAAVLGAAVLAGPTPAGALLARGQLGASSVSTGSTEVITVQVASPFGSPGAVQLQDLSGNVLGTCQGSTSPGSATCTVDVSFGEGVVFVAQPLTAGAFKNWTAACGPVSGPVCELRVASNVKVVGHFGSTPPTPSAVTTTNVVAGDTPGCSGFGDGVTVNGSRFPVETPVTLSDDGHVVASSTTDPSGFAQLSYTATSEPGVYRSLVMGAAGATATTDIYNIGSVCYTQTGSGTGTDSFQVVGADFDANSPITIKLGSNAAVSATTSASGTFTATTPSYACKAGANRNLVIKAVRGAGTPVAHIFDFVFVAVC